MNIFILGFSFKEIVEAMPDRHVVKMILEYTQLLCTAHRLLDGNEKADECKFYRATHKNHPCSIWVRESSSNYIWLHALLGGLFKEYTHRYGKTHASSLLYCDLYNLPKGIPLGPITLFALAMPEKYKPKDYTSLGQAVQAYRNYFIGEKNKLKSWKKRTPPSWWIE